LERVVYLRLATEDLHTVALPVLSLEIALKLCDRANFAMYGIKRETWLIELRVRLGEPVNYADQQETPR
jgi:hypothetical protein